MLNIKYKKYLQLF